MFNMVNVDKLKELKKKLTKFKKVSKKDSEKGEELAKEIISIIDVILMENLDNEKLKNNLNMTKGSLNLYLDNLRTMDELKNKWN